jgi:hypothetical protein
MEYWPDSVTAANAAAATPASAGRGSCVMARIVAPAAPVLRSCDAFCWNGLRKSARHLAFCLDSCRRAA